MSNWTREAIRRIEADIQRSADTHLVQLELPACPGIDLYFKDESSHPSGSLKHRLARSLFLYGICNGWIGADTPVIEASSGSTAVSEAYFARLLGLRFIAVIPCNTSAQKIEQIRFYGGECHLVEKGGNIYSTASQLAQQLNGHYMDQFTYAERATDWRGNNNIAESIFQQMARETFPEPTWIVIAAGTGGTSATIGRYIRYHRAGTRLCVPDPENSVFFDYYQSGDPQLTANAASRIEGIGRPWVEPSFMRSVVDRMIKVPDAASIAAIQVLEQLLNRRCGGSTGTNLYAAVQLIAEMQANDEQGSLVTLLCDSGDRYRDTYYNPAWLQQSGIDPAPYRAQLEEFFSSGTWRPLSK